MSIIGVSLVLLMLGFLGWVGINYYKLVVYFRESVPVQVFLRETTNETEKDALLGQVQALVHGIRLFAVMLHGFPFPRGNKSGGGIAIYARERHLDVVQA